MTRVAHGIEILKVFCPTGSGLEAWQRRWRHVARQCALRRSPRL